MSRLTDVDISRRITLVAISLLSFVALGCDGVVPDEASGVGAQPLPDPTRPDLRSQETSNGYRFWPSSAPVEEGVEYEFNTGHCGLDFLTDFDGSFWRPVDPNDRRNPPRPFYSEDNGTILLTTANEARYKSSTGDIFVLERIDGAITLHSLCD